MSREGTEAARGNYESLVCDMSELATSLNRLHKQMADACAPIVEDLIRRRCRDQKQIERLLDILLDCACIPEGLALFKTLCRYYYSLNPAAAASYVFIYRDMWDSDSEAEKESRTGAKRRGGAGASPRRQRRLRRGKRVVGRCVRGQG